jgi:long-subunit fatty acid transport protein
MAPRPTACFVTLSAFLALASLATGQSPADRDTDRIDITGRQNLTLGSGARAYGMGGAFLARADDATAASWNPAGLSYLRVPELSLVGVSNSFDATRGDDFDRFDGKAVDFAAFTWPVGFGEVRGAVQVSYQRAISFDGRRSIQETRTVTAGTTRFTDDARSDGGFDVIAFGTGLRLSRHVRAGLTVNRWLNGYSQTLDRRFLTPSARPLREFDLDFRTEGWSFNFGVMVSPVEQVNLAAVYKTPFTASLELDKARRDYWALAGEPEQVTSNAGSSDAARLDFPSSLGFGVSWRPRDTLTLSADFTRTSWSEARILNYFELVATPPTDDGIVGVPPPPVTFPQLQYPTLRAVPDPDGLDQLDAQQIRLGVEWVLIKGRAKVPLRAGYFNDRQITAVTPGDAPRFNGFTVGTGLILGPMLLDVAYVREFGEYTVATTVAGNPGLDVPPTTTPTTVRSTLTTNRFFASVIYRFSRGWRP